MLSSSPNLNTPMATKMPKRKDSGFNPESTIINYQLSIINCQLSIVNYDDTVHSAKS